MPRMKLLTIFIEYTKNSTFHGARYIWDESCHWIERVFWLICVILSWVGSGIVIASSLEAYQNNPISFVVETSYKDWDTHFPSIIVCETRNLDGVQRVAEELWGANYDFTLEESISELAYFKGESYHTIHQCGGADPNRNCLLGNFSIFARKVRSQCFQTMENCYWNHVRFTCCEYFLPMETEFGICYALNSLQARDPHGARLKTVSNKVHGPGAINFEILTEANVYILGEEEVPSLVTSKTEYFLVTRFINYTRRISVLNIENDSEVRDVRVKQRKCRFPDETESLTVHRKYSYSACAVQCHKDAQMRLCGCTSHLMPNTDLAEHCNMTGLICLNKNNDILSIVIAEWSKNRRGLVCDCLPSCTELDIAVRQEDVLPFAKATSPVTIALQTLPTERYRRNVVRGKLDLVVSMGGTTSLFVGASLLSFVELIYYFTVRIYGTYKINKNAPKNQ